jgi:hypothetical protein
MTGMVGGQLEDLRLNAWIGITPDGTKAVYLLLTADETDRARNMPAVAGALGLNPEPGSVTRAVDPARLHIAVGTDSWIHLVQPAGHLTRPLSTQLVTMIRNQRRAVVIVGYEAVEQVQDPWDYVDRFPDQLVLGMVTAAVS